MHILMTWFLPVGITLGVVGTQTTKDFFFREKKKRLEGVFALLLAWVPLLAWMAAQFLSDPVR